MKKTATSPNCVSAIAEGLIPGLRKRCLGGACSPFDALWNSNPRCYLHHWLQPINLFAEWDYQEYSSLLTFFFLIKVGRTCIGSQAHAVLSNAESMILLPSPAAALTGALLSNCCKAHSAHQKLWAFTLVFSLVVCEWIAYVEAFPAVSDGHFYSCAFDSESCSVAELVEIKWVMLQAIHSENFSLWKFNREQSWV